MTGINHTPSLRDEVQRLSRVLNELQNSLRTHRETLRQRGMSLPMGVLKNLQDTHIGLEQLGNDLKTEDVELTQLRALADTTEMMNSTLDLDEVLSRTMDTVANLTGAERAYLMLRNEETGMMEYRVARNLDRETIERTEFTVSRSVVNQVAETGEPVVTTNAQNDPRFASQESIVSYAVRSILCVPLKHKGEVIGVIYADNRIRDNLFGKTERDLLYAFANQAAVAITNARLFERIRSALVEITQMKDLMDNVFTSIASGVIITDGENRIKMQNKAASEILRMNPDSSIGNAIGVVLPTLADGLLKLLEAVRTENRRTMVELTTEIDERGPRNLNLKLSPLRNPDQVTEGVAIVLDDMTDTRQREQQLNVVRRYLPPAMVDNIQSIAQLGLGGVRRHITVMYVDVRPVESLP
ncbi:MAG: GAF domain-containing protein, partial [Anaerolineae bacterium]|nr:GAF domain-containing protein [Anaerolineae bacterium]